MLLSDQDIAAVVFGPKANPNALRLIDPLPSEGSVDWRMLDATDPLWHSKQSPIQPASLDLHVGYIYVPGTQPHDLGGEGRGATCHAIAPGHSVIVSTYEKLTLPSTMGGIVFPPSELSSKGILVANIGHIDPGFSGHLRFTIINMGGKTFSLERGKDAVGTLLLFRLSSESKTPWLDRRGSVEPKGQPTGTEIDSLAKDFANIEVRVEQMTRKTVNRLQWRFGVWSVVLPIVFGIALAVWAIWFETGRSLSGRIDEDQQAIADLRENLASVKARSDPQQAELITEVTRLGAELAATNRELAELRRDFQKQAAPAAKQ